MAPYKLSYYCCCCPLQLFITSPVGAVAKYCYEYVCVCICVSVCLSVRPPGYHMCDSLLVFLCMLLMAVTWSSSSRVTKSQGERAILEVFLPIDYAL